MSLRELLVALAVALGALGASAGLGLLLARVLP
jgi:hypothetical protein